MGQTSGLLGRAAIYIASSRLGTCLAKLGDRFIPRITRNNGTPKKIVPIVYTSYTREMIEAYEGDVYVGRIEFSYQTDVEQHKAKNCMINMLAVDAPYRNKGIGKKLLHQAFAIMEQRGAERIAWISAPLELKALTQQQLNAFYTRQGGVNTGGNMFEYRIKSPTKS
jgi:GNAT superfamily N-acetyltransferase